MLSDLAIHGSPDRDWHVGRGENPSDAPRPAGDQLDHG